MNTQLISKSDFAKATRLKEQNPLIGILYRISGIEKVNHYYAENHHLSDLAFVDGCLDLLELRIKIDDKDLNRIPASGPFITISNHPFGAIDGLALIQTLAAERSDFKVLSNFLLNNIEQLQERFIGVNPLPEKQSKKSSVKGMREALRHLENGNALGIFPSGEVSTFRKDVGSISDGPWDPQMIKLIKNAGVPVIPVYFDGRNSRLFHLMGAIHPSLRTLRLPAEFANKKGKKLRMRIGHPISPKELKGFESTAQLSRFLRAKTYALGTSLDVKKEYFASLRFPQKPKNIIPQVDTELLIKDLQGCENNLLFEHPPFKCYLASAREIPHILREIGRLREATFRSVGEGTNKSQDIDEYDLYYHHLFLWDTSEDALVGAYRIGKGQDIMRRFGKKGFYINSLFKMSKEMKPILEQSIELGRSFIQPSYQKHRMPLFLLWKGILHTLISEKDHRYVIGPVTISGSYKKASKTLIMGFIEKHYFDQKLSKYVTPRTPFVPDLKSYIDKDALLNAMENDVKKLDRTIRDIEPSSITVPVLLKKYLHQNARILGFNLDPKFNNALDGLMILDMEDLPSETIENLQKELLVTEV